MYLLMSIYDLYRVILATYWLVVVSASFILQLQLKCYIKFVSVTDRKCGVMSKILISAGHFCGKTQKGPFCYLGIVLVPMAW